MNKNREYLSNSIFLHILIIAVVVLLFSVLYSHHFVTVMPDRGREFMLPEAILNGAVPYKDITLIYFPLAYYINAFIYMILGVSINSLIISQTIFCIFFMLIYYFLAKEFLPKVISLLLTILVITCCIFSVNDLFSFIVPYAYATSFGVMGTTLVLFAMVKLFKTDNLKYAYIAAVASGFSVCCKVEFLSSFVILVLGLLLYKRLKIFDYIKIFISFMIFPFITLSILLSQRVSFAHITDAVDFGRKFAGTSAMKEFLSDTGMYPINLFNKFKNGFSNLIFCIIFVLSSFLGLLIHNKFSNLFVLLSVTGLVLWICYDFYRIEYYWLLLPIFLGFLFILKWRLFLKTDRTFLLLIVSSLFLSYKVFFWMSVMDYGTYSFPLLILALAVTAYKFLPEQIKGIKTETILEYLIVILIILYSYNLNSVSQETSNLFETDKGSIYLHRTTYNLLNSTIKYIDKNIDKNSSVLVLPEGNIINFLTGRKVDLKCFMMDRLYHDAYGEAAARDMIANTNSDYIILIKGLRTSSFNRPYLYARLSTLSAQYIWDNYTTTKTFSAGTSKVMILKKNALKN